MEYGDRVARIEADVETLKNETLRLRDGHHQIANQVQAAAMAAATVSAEVRAFIANAEVQAEQIAHRVYLRIKREEADLKATEGASAFSGMFVKVVLALVGVIGVLGSLVAAGKL